MGATTAHSDNRTVTGSPAARSDSSRLAFTYAGPARSVRFGPGVSRDIDAVLKDLDRSRVVALVTPSQHEQGDHLHRMLGERLVAVCQDIHPHVPERDVTASCALARERSADVIVAVGGGSAIGLAKAVASTIGVPYVAVPTTYSGSEMTDFFGVTVDGRKESRRTPLAASRVVLYDPDLTVSMPAELTGSSGVNAMAQAVGSLYASGTSPISRLYAADGLRRLVSSIPTCVESPRDMTARSQALLGAHLCGAALAGSGLSSHHRVVHQLGALTSVPHASLHAALLPQTTAWAIRRHAEVGRILTRELGEDPAGTLFDLLGRLDLAPGLEALGLDRSSYKPVKATVLERIGGDWAGPLGDLSDLLDASYEGLRPSRQSTARATGSSTQL